MPYLKGAYVYSQYWWPVFAALMEDENIIHSVLNKIIFITNSDNNQFANLINENERVVQRPLLNGLQDIQNQGDTVVSAFKSLLNFNQNYFEKAYKNDKTPFIIIGSGSGDNNDLEDYAKLLMTYYGFDAYCYYCKAHPKHPISDDPMRQETDSLLDIDEVDSTIPAELIIFFNPNIKLCGNNSSVFQSVSPGLDAAMFRINKSTGVGISAYDSYKACDFWSSQITDKSADKYKNKCKMTYKNFLVEFSDSIISAKVYSYATWDSTESKLTYYSSLDKKVGDSINGVGFSATISNGLYYINSSLSNKKLIDVSGGSLNNGANVWLYDFNGTPAQKWYLESNIGGFYKIKCAGSNKCLDVWSGNASCGNNLWQYEDNDSIAQKWLIESNGSGYKIESALYRWLTLDVCGVSINNGTNIHIYNSNNSPAQSFGFVSCNPNVELSSYSISDGDYYIKSSMSQSKIINILSHSINNGGNVQLNSFCEDNSNQIFNFKKVGNYYIITNKRTNKCLDLDSGLVFPGTSVQQWDYSANNNNQLWFAISYNDKCIFMNVASGLVLDVSGGNTANGTNIWGYSRNNSAAQQWILQQAGNWNLANLPNEIYSISLHNNNNKSIDVSGGSLSDAANIQLYDKNNINAQKWQITTNNCFSTITNVGSGLSLDIAGGRIGCGTNVWQYSVNGTDAQKWLIYKNSNGSYKIVSAVNKYIVLDLSGGNQQNGSNIQVYDSNGSSAQCWSITSINN